MTQRLALTARLSLTVSKWREGLMYSASVLPSSHLTPSNLMVVEQAAGLDTGFDTLRYSTLLD